MKSSDSLRVACLMLFLWAENQLLILGHALGSLILGSRICVAYKFGVFLLQVLSDWQMGGEGLFH